jgi:hypothetical protein
MKHEFHLFIFSKLKVENNLRVRDLQEESLIEQFSLKKKKSM